MNWSAIRQHNTAISARKAARERRAAEIAQRYADLGGDVKLDELRQATRETVTPPNGSPFEVWCFRGRQWVVCRGVFDGIFAHLYTGQTRLLNYMETARLTAGATKWFLSQEPRS